MDIILNVLNLFQLKYCNYRLHLFFAFIIMSTSIGIITIIIIIILENIKYWVITKVTSGIAII